MTASEAVQLYLRRAMEQMPRSISLEDRERVSKTYGCFDRTYWAWKFVDFPGARYQEGIFPLAFVYAVADDDQGYRGNAKVLEWIEAGLGFWSRIQYRDGSFDEAYPYEHSLAATAFTSFYVAEVLQRVQSDLDETTRRRTLETLARAGEWLVRNDETHGFLSNHLAAAAAGLLHIGQLTNEERFVARSRYFLDRILRHQSKEGWYEEYGGADPGYQTHATFYLARYWQLCDDEELLKSLNRSAEFLSHFVHPDGTLGGEYGSRSTQFVYPAGFEMLADRSESARWIAGRMAESIRERRAASLETMDAQNFYPLLNNFLFAAEAAMHREIAEPPCVDANDVPMMLEFPDAGLIKVRRPRYELIVGTSKGGVVKLFSRTGRRLLGSDCGYVGRMRDGRVATSQILNRTRRADIEPDRITVETRFAAVKRTVFRPGTFLAFRLVNLTLGRVPSVALWIKSLLVRVLITKRQDVPLVLRRSILLGENGIEIVDQVRAERAIRLESLRREDVFSTVHMGSSRYFQVNELEQATAGQGAPSAGDVPLTELTGGIELRRPIQE